MTIHDLVQGARARLMNAGISAISPRSMPK